MVSTHSCVKSHHVSLSTPQQRLNGELDSLRFRYIHMPKPQHRWLLQVPSLQVVVLPPPSWQHAEIFLSPAPKNFANSKCSIITAGNYSTSASLQQFLLKIIPKVSDASKSKYFAGPIWMSGLSMCFVYKLYQWGWIVVCMNWTRLNTWVKLFERNSLKLMKTKKIGSQYVL